MSTFEDLQQAYKELQETIVKQFNVASGGPIESIGVDASKDIANEEYGLLVVLQREPTDEEKEYLPDEHLGIPVSYAVKPS